MNNPIKKALTNPGLAIAIKGQCYLCMGGDISDEHVKQSVCEEIRQCHLKKCSLWPLRPYRDEAQRAEDLTDARERGSQINNEDAMGDPALRAAQSPDRRRACISGKCFDCVGAGADPAPRRLVRECTVHDCPIYPVRTWK